MKKFILTLILGCLFAGCNSADEVEVASGISLGQVKAVEAYELECIALKNSIHTNINVHQSLQEKLELLIQNNKELPTDFRQELTLLKDSLRSCQIAYMNVQQESDELASYATTFLTECSDADRKVSSADYRQELDWQTGLYKDLFARVSAIVLNNSVYYERLNALLASRQLTLN